MTVDEAIAELGPTRESAIETLRDFKVKTAVRGEHFDALTSCLIATYLKKRGVEFRAVSMTHIHMSYDKGNSIVLPEHIISLVRAWCYHELPEFEEAK